MPHPDPNSVPLETLIQNSPTLPAEEKQRWLDNLSRLNPEQTAELKKIFLEEAARYQEILKQQQPELQAIQKEYLQKIKDFKRQKMAEIRHHFEAKDAQQTEAEKAKILSEIDQL